MKPENYDYILHLERACRGLLKIDAHQSSDLAELGAKIGSRWLELEAAAKIDGYDVLMGFHWEICRGATTILLHLLYQIPGASYKADIEQIVEKDREYGSSWIQRGGVGAFFSAVRKVDRIWNQLNRCDGSLAEALKRDNRQEGILDDLGDLRRYLLLWEAWWIARETA